MQGDSDTDREQQQHHRQQYAAGGRAHGAVWSPLKRTMKRSSSFTALTELQQAMAHQHTRSVQDRMVALAAAKELAQHAQKLRGFVAFVLFECILILGYVCYRNVACPLLQWQCSEKTWQGHYDDVTALATIGGALYSTGPTITGTFTFVFNTLVMFVAALFSFGAAGELPFLMNSLNSSVAWQPPAVFVYVGVFVLVIIMIGYSFRITRSRYELAVSLLVFVALLGIYVSPLVVAASAGVPVTSVTYHPHHYQLAWSLCLLLRHPTDPPIILARWALMGVCVQGLAAYSAASIVSN